MSESDCAGIQAYNLLALAGFPAGPYPSGGGAASAPLCYYSSIYNYNSQGQQPLTLSGMASAGDRIVVIQSYKSGTYSGVSTGYTELTGSPFTANGYTLRVFTRIATGNSADNFDAGLESNNLLTTTCLIFANAGTPTNPSGGGISPTTGSGDTAQTSFPSITPAAGSAVIAAFVNDNQPSGGNPYPPALAVPPGFNYVYGPGSSDNNLVVFVGTAWTDDPFAFAFMGNNNNAGVGAIFSIPAA